MNGKMYLLDISPLDIFKWGIDYDQLLMEEERDGEDLADAFQGSVIGFESSTQALNFCWRMSR